jgi:assimilatory nitrate reductase catalytic subunit
MAELPEALEKLTEEYGPHLKFTPEGGWQRLGEPDRRVNTHCCFCGQQCGITLLVKQNKVIGLDPWTDFPFNKGRLCPKGVKRYMQDSHPDRLLSPLIREANGFRSATWDEALDLTARRIREIQQKYGKDRFAVLSGASLTNEKAYLMGKFARVALQTRQIDYNGRLCMASATAGNERAFGIDRACNPWSDIPEAKCLMLVGTNVGECSPITTDYVWQARDNGGKIIVIDPRMTPIARTADLFIPVRPGTDSALMNSILHTVIERGYTDERFIREHTVGFEAVRDAVRKYTPEHVSKICGVRPELIVEAAELWGRAGTGMLLHAKGVEHHTKGVDNVLTCINLVLATGRLGRPGCGYGAITGQGNGQGAREHGQKCTQLPGFREIENPEDREYIAKIWGIPESELPHRGSPAVEIIELIHGGEIKGLLSICFNPLVSLPDANFTREALSKLEFYAGIDFFLSETLHHADVVLAGSLQEEDEGTTTNVEARVVRIRQAVKPPAGARLDWEILCDLARRLGRGQYFEFKNTEEIFNELRIASKGGRADYFGITWEKIEKNYGVFWPCPTPDHPGTPRLFEDGRFYFPDGRARFNVVEYRPSAEMPDAEYPIILTTGRVVYQYLSGTQTRRIGWLTEQYPEPLVEMHPRLAAKLGVTSGDLVRVTSRRGSVELKADVVATIRPDTIFIPYHWAGKQSANLLTQRAVDPISKIPEYKVSAVRVERA